MQGFYGIYKEKGPTSFRVIAELRRITGVKTIGHAGTLDPLAQGVLVVAIGRDFTRKINEIVNTEKEYIADIKLGYESTTDDEEGEKTATQDAKRQETGKVQEVINKFIGKIKQVPPIYSAIKVGGKRAYKLARKGVEQKMEPRAIEIKDIKILEYNWPILRINVTTGKGAYIRALARDIGRELGTGGYLTGLERTRVGEFSKANSLTVKEFASKFKDSNI